MAILRHAGQSNGYLASAAISYHLVNLDAFMSEVQPIVVAVHFRAEIFWRFPVCHGLRPQDKHSEFAAEAWFGPTQGIPPT
jgi:hypothetical protein